MDAAYRIIKLPMMVMVFTLMSAAISEAAEQTFPENPKFEVDASWPKLPLPNNWTLGEVGGITVDARDHVWIVQRPGTLFTYEKGASFEPPISNCCIPAPPVMEFDQEGNVVSAWGGPGEGYEWPDSEHGISIDYKGNVWIAGNGRGSRDDDSVPPDGVVLKFSPDGEFLLQIGQRAPSKGSSDPNQLAGPADMAVDPETNEVFVADGYRNHRVIVFDGDTGEFKRMWGAYGRRPTDKTLSEYDPAAPPPEQFRNVHCVEISADGLLYVCDRDNNRVQVFQRDGTFVKEYFYLKNTLSGRGPGSVADINFWPDEEQSVFVTADIANSQVRFARRADGEVIGVFGHFGNYGGQFNRLHQAAIDSNGVIYTSEAAGKRVQKFLIVK